MKLRALLLVALAAATCPAAALAQTAASYPNRPITLVVPYTPGSGIDILARVIAPKLNRKWGEPVVVDNKPGASGIIGADAVAKAAPNGYTLMVTVNSFTMAPSLYRDMPYDPVADFTPGAMTALLGGRVQMMFATVHALLPSQKAGKLKFLAVTGPRRSPLAPDAPTFRERGFDFMDDIDGWYAVMGPARLPRDIVAKLNAEFRAIMFQADVREQLTNQGLVPVASTPEGLAALIKADLPRWAKVVAEAKISAD